jgi:hypothetical protein
MPFKPFTYEQHYKFLTDALRRRLPNVDVSPGSFWHIWAQGQARGLVGVTSALTSVGRQILPDTATGLDLDHHAKVYDLPRFSAAAATGRVLATVTGEYPLIPPTDLNLRDNAGRRYDFAPFSRPFAGTFEIEITATEPGSAGNKAPDTVLYFYDGKDPIEPSALDPEALVVAPGVQWGRDLETDPKLQARIVDTLSAVPLSDTQASYERWALYRWPCVQPVPNVFTLENAEGDEKLYQVSEVWVYRDPVVGNRVYLLALAQPERFEPPDRIGPPGFLQEVFNAVDRMLPVTVDLIVPKIDELRVDVTLYVEPRTESRWDWRGRKKIGDTSTERKIVLQFTEGTFDPYSGLDGVAGLRAGMRVLINGEQRTIGHVDVALNQIWLTEDLSAVPDVDTLVYPGGPVTEPVQQAVADLFRTVGPLHKVLLPTDRGHNVLPSAITDSLMALPEVHDALVAGVESLIAPDPTSGDASVLDAPAYVEGTLAYLAVPGAVTVAPMEDHEHPLL